jgi:hypothetical protein
VWSAGVDRSNRRENRAMTIAMLMIDLWLGFNAIIIWWLTR